MRIIQANYSGSANPSGEHGRTIRPEIIANGYGEIFKACKRGYEKGVRDFFIHLPAGRQFGERDKVMDFDMFAEVKEQIDDEKFHDHVLHPRNYTDELRKGLQWRDATFNTYVGSLPRDADMDLARPDKWISRVVESLEPILAAPTNDSERARCGIVFDDICGGHKAASGPDTPETRTQYAPEGGAIHRLLQLIQSFGHAVSVEPIAWRNMSQWLPFDSFTTVQHWTNQWQQDGSRAATGRQYLLVTADMTVWGRRLTRHEQIKKFSEHPRVDGLVVYEADLEYALTVV